MSDCEDSEGEEDSRISQLQSFIAENPDSEPGLTIQFLEKLGGKSGMIYGGMCFDEDFTLAHFLIMGILNHEREGKKLTAQIEESKGVLKAFNSSDKRQKMFLVAMELYIMKERPKGISRYNEVLKKLWESDIVEDEQVEWWQNTENTLQQFSPEFNLDDAVVIREVRANDASIVYSCFNSIPPLQSGLKFLEWLREGE